MFFFYLQSQLCVLLHFIFPAPKKPLLFHYHRWKIHLLFETHPNLTTPSSKGSGPSPFSQSTFFMLRLKTAFTTLYKLLSPHKIML